MRTRKPVSTPGKKRGEKKERTATDASYEIVFISFARVNARARLPFVYEYARIISPWLSREQIKITFEISVIQPWKNSDYKENINLIRSRNTTH